MRIKKSTVFLTMFVLLLAFTGCQNESSSTDENKQTKSTASDKVIYNQKNLQNPVDKGHTTCYNNQAVSRAQPAAAAAGAFTYSLYTVF